MRRHRRTSCAIAAASLLASANLTLAATATWDGSETPDLNWSNTLNWTGSQPGGADVIFNAGGVAGTAGTTTNVMDVGDITLTRSINSLWYQNVTGQFHTTVINPGYTLRIFGHQSGQPANSPVNNSALYVGLGADPLNTTTVTQANITGATGTLFIDNVAGDLTVTQVHLTGATGSQNAILDMSGLGTFNANMRDINVGTIGGADPYSRAVGTLFLAQTNNLNVNSIVVGNNRQNRAYTSLGSKLFLGTTNNINASTITVGQSMSTAGTLMAYKTGISGGTLVIRGPGGTGRANLNVGVQNLAGGLTNPTSASLDLTTTSGAGTGSIDAQIGTLMIGRPGNGSGTGSSGTGVLTFDTGVIDANDVVVGTNNATNNPGNSLGTGTLNVKGAAKFIANTSFGIAVNVPVGGSTSTSTSVGTLNVSGATAKVTAASTIADGGGTSNVVIDTGGTLQSRGLTIDNVTVNTGTVVMDLGTLSNTVPASAWGTVGNLNAGSGTNTLDFVYSGSLGTGSFTALNFTTGSANFALPAKLPARVTASINNNPTNVTVNILTSNQPRWDGTLDGNWDIEVGPNGTANWKLVNGGAATKYQEDLVTYSTTDKVVFDDNAAGTTTVTLTTTLAPSSVTVNNSSLPYTFTGGGKLTGGGGIVKQGTNTLTISNTGGNDFTGGVSISAGTVATGANEVLPNSGSVTIAGGTLNVSTFTETVSALTLSSGSVTGTSGSITGGITAQSGTLAANIAGASTVTKSTAGTVTVSGNNTYTGNTTLQDQNNGVLLITSNNALGASTAGTSINGARDNQTLQLSNNITSPEPIKIRGRTGGATPNLDPHIVNIADNNTITGTMTMETDGTLYTLQSDAGKLTVNTLTNNTSSTDTARTIFLKGAGDGEIGSFTSGTLVDNYINVTKQDSGTWTLGTTNIVGTTKLVGGKVIYSGTSKMGLLDLDPTTSVEVSHSNTGYKVVTVGKLNMFGAKLDLKNNRLIDNGSVAPADTVATISNYVQSGRGTVTGGVPQWNGDGIITTESDAGPVNNFTNIGVATGADAKGLSGAATATWSGQTVTATSVLAMYTFNGDANLSGNVDADDYFQIDRAYAQNGALTGWANGDFNYDGTINGDDFALIDIGFNANQSMPNFAPGAPAGVTAVPEPASLSLLGLAATGLLRRRRRQVC